MRRRSPCAQRAAAPGFRFSGLPFTNRQTYSSKLPNSRCTSRNAIALVTAELILSRLRMMPSFVQQRSNLSLIVFRDFLRIETVESCAIVVAFAENRFPTKTGLRSFEYQKFKETRCRREPARPTLRRDRRLIKASWPRSNVAATWAAIHIHRLHRLNLRDLAGKTLHHRHEFSYLDRLGDVRVVTGGNRADAILRARVGSERNGGNVLTLSHLPASHLPDEVVTIGIRHADVANQQIKLVRA